MLRHTLRRNHQLSAESIARPDLQTLGAGFRGIQALRQNIRSSGVKWRLDHHWTILGFQWKELRTPRHLLHVSKSMGEVVGWPPPHSIMIEHIKTRRGFGVEELDWPPNSPDLHSREHLWDKLETKRLRERPHHPKSFTWAHRWLLEEHSHKHTAKSCGKPSQNSWGEPPPH